MARKRYKPEEIVAKLRQVDVLVSQGRTMVDAIRQIGGERGDVLSVAPGVWRPEERAGEAPEG
jgi:hypothetical protein